MRIDGDASGLAGSGAVLNCLNLLSLEAGRPAPLEAPDSAAEALRQSPTGVNSVSEFCAAWLAWLAKAWPEHEAAWAKRAAKKQLHAAECVAALLWFDIMSYHAARRRVACFLDGLRL